jgi:hypothetical protein
MKLLEAIRKRWTIRSHARRLPKMLRDDNGFSQTCNPHQIKATIERNRFNLDHASNAISMFSDWEGFAQHQDDTGKSYKYEAMRNEVTARYFNGDVNFTVSNVMHAFPDGACDVSGGGWHGGADAQGGHGDSGSGH